MNTNVLKFNSIFELNKTLAGFITYLANESIKQKGFFTLALSGGKTPISLYRLISLAEYSDKIDWCNTYIFLSDERYLAANNKNSNYFMANEALISKISIPEENVFSYNTNLINILDVSLDYERRILEFFKLNNNDTPSFDLILLGLGNDGHTASLFPANEALSVNNRLVAPVTQPGADITPERITFTYRLINNAQNVVFIVTGEHKYSIFKEIKENNKEASLKYPAAGVNAENIFWYLVEN
ncbi:MAG: 6-phosphogluconolactonase [Cyanobacteriota bacterium]